MASDSAASGNDNGQSSSSLKPIDLQIL